MPARRRPPGVRLGLDRRSGPVGSAFLVDVADDIVAIDCDSADRVEVVQEIATELQGHGYRPFGLLPVGPVTNICSSPSFVERQAQTGLAWETFNRFAGLGTLHALRTLVFSLAHRLAATFPGPGTGRPR